MEAAAIVRHLYAAGISLELHGEHLAAFPASRLNEQMRALVKANKPALLDYLLETQQITTALIDAAMRACDHWRDQPAARTAMHSDIHATPPHLRGDLLDHFSETYGRHT